MSRARALLVLVLVAVPALFLGLGRRDLWNPTEPRYAGIAAEMLRDGHWLVPTYNGRIYDQKPALYFWFTAAGLRLGDDRESRLFGVRLPSALGGLLLACATFLLGRRLFDSGTGLLAGAMILTCWLSFWSGRFCHMDTLTAASLAFLLHGLLARAEGGSWLHLVEAGLALAVGLLLKGPGTLVFALLTFALTALHPARRGLWRRSGLVLVLPVGLVLAAAWFLPAARAAGPAWARGLLIDAGILHLVDPSNAAKHSPFYYLSVIWGVAAPWSLVLPGAVLGRVRAWRRGALDERERAGLAFILAWFGAILIVLHLGTTYRSRYLLPALPPLMLLVARSIRVDLDARDPAAALGRTGLGIGLSALLVAGLTMIFGGRLGHLFSAGILASFLDHLGRAEASILPLGLVTAFVALFGFYRLAANRTRSAAAALVAAIALGFAGWGLHGAPAMDRVHGDRELLAVLRESLPGRDLAAIESYGSRESTEGYFGFELGRPLICLSADRAELAARRDGAPMLLMLRERDLANLERGALDGWTRLGDHALGRHHLWLFCNDDAASRR
ncbi:MAG: glycosyltransferase family 39 protein [Planctomycetes bacterium]|nr:glycosyltransferase family 39 protein [Planctomycetota bacterium]